MIEVKLTFPTIDDALAAVSLLAGITTSGVDVEEKPAKKATPAQKAAKATVDEFDEPAAKPAKAGKKAKAKVPSVDELKAHILELAGDGADQPTKVKEYVRSFGVAKISDMTEAQRAEAFNGAEEYFAAEEEADPMD